jgi:hypothetical protein
MVKVTGGGANTGAVAAHFAWTYPDSVDGLWLVDDAVGG